MWPLAGEQVDRVRVRPVGTTGGHRQLPHALTTYVRLTTMSGAIKKLNETYGAKARDGHAHVHWMDIRTAMQLDRKGVGAMIHTSPPHDRGERYAHDAKILPHTGSETMSSLGPGVQTHTGTMVS